ncbi:MAG: ABC transporter permease [Methanobrevibacter sp.]|nr:ABC transporter permease [Candidatus Methanovirga meridionalis]
MSFLGIILKNPFRSKVRAILAIVGIGIGIATIVVLGAVTAGLVSTLDETLHADGADFSIMSKESSPTSILGFASLNEDWIDKIKNIDGIAAVTGAYIGIFNVENDPYFRLIGINSQDTGFTKLEIIEGRIFNEGYNEIVLGKLTADKLNKTIDDTLTVNNQNFKVEGISETGDQLQDNSAFTSLTNVQNLSHNLNEVSAVYAKLDKSSDMDIITKRIESQYGDEVNVIRSISDLGTMTQTLNIVNSASLGISLLAIIIGAIGIINTTITSVYERTRELGVLKAMGWKKRRILLMILGESLVLTITAAIVGSIVGIIGVELLKYLNILQGMTPIFTIGIFINAFIIAITVGLIGAFYPAYRAIKLPPTEAIRYE